MDFLNPPRDWEGCYRRVRMVISRTAAQGLAVSLEEMLLDLRADSQDENETVVRLIKGMTDYFEIRTGWRLSPAAYEARIACGVEPWICIPRGPVRSVEAVSYYDATTKAWVEIDSENYTVDEMGTDFSVYLSNDFWPNLPGGLGTIPYPYKIKFMAGFDPQQDDATGEINTSVVGPAADGMIVALKGLIALGFQNREAGNNLQADQDQILRGYRRFW